QFTHVVLALLFGLLFQVFIGYVQFAFKRDLGLQFLGEAAPEAGKGANLGGYLTSGNVYGIGGLMGHPNLLSAYLAMLLPLFISLLFTSYKLILKILFVVAVILGGGALLLTLSRSGWAAFALGFLCLLFFSFTNPHLRSKFMPLKISMM